MNYLRHYMIYIKFKEIVMEYIIDSDWKWAQCNLVIKRAATNNFNESHYESLQAEIQLTSQHSQVNQFQPEIWMQKKIDFQPHKGFIWHKSWYIPELTVKISPKIIQLLREQGNIKKVYCQFLCGFPFKKQDHYYLQEVKLQGETLKQISKKGQAKFTHIKFSQTSFNKNKNKFSLIIVIFAKYKQNQKTILKSFLSSPIHVDSRKQARKKISANTFMLDQVTVQKFLQPLQGVQKVQLDTMNNEELYSISGFIKYYTAANIRFKIKHPYYVGYHFDKIFDVYYNSQEADDAVNVLDQIFQNQKQKDLNKKKQKQVSKKKLDGKSKQILKKDNVKILLFLIKNNSKNETTKIQKQSYQQQKRQNNEPNVSQQQSAQNQQQQRQQKEIKIPIPIQASYFTKGLLIAKNDLQMQIKFQQQMKDYPIVELQNQVSKKESKNYQTLNLQQDKRKVSNCQMLKSFNQQENIKKIYSMFQAWKFGFVELKKSDGGMTVINKNKWILINKQNLLKSFQKYSEKIQKIDLNQNQFLSQQLRCLKSRKQYEKYEIHQAIELQINKKKEKQFQSV